MNSSLVIMTLVSLYLGIGFIILGRLQANMILIKPFSVVGVLLLPSIVFVKIMSYINRPNFACLGLFIILYGYMMVTSFISYQVIKPLFWK